MSKATKAQEPSNDVTAVFEQFPLLPPELRLLVWEEVSTTPRCIDVWPVTAENDEGFDEFMKVCAIDYLPPPFKYRSHNPVPPILHVCREARSTGLKYYKLSFGYYTEIKAGFFTLEIKIPPQIYVNFECNIICPIISTPRTELCNTFQETLSMADGIPIQRIALPKTKSWNDGFWHNWDMMHQLPLKEIIVYAGTPAGTKKRRQPFHPADALPFVLELVSLNNANKYQKFKRLEYGKMTRGLTNAAAIMLKDISEFENFSRPDLNLRCPVINKMYLHSSARKI